MSTVNAKQCDSEEVNADKRERLEMIVNKAKDVQHTPGPWIGAGPSFGDKLPRYTDEVVTDRAEEDECITICTLPWAFHDEEQEANACLIAAAPDLLDVVKDFHTWASNQADAQSKGGHATFDLLMLREQRDKAEAVIAKAQGGAA